MGHKVIDNTQNTAVQDQLEALKQLKDRLASHTKFGFLDNLLIIAWLFGQLMGRNPLFTEVKPAKVRQRCER